MTTTFGAIDVIKAPATLSGSDSQQCATQIRSSIERHRVRIVLDLSGTALMDSLGLEMLLECNENCLRRGGELVLAGPTPLCQEILEITGLEQELNCHKDLRSALGSFAR
jgi:anti-anti-sigma factor